METWEEAGTLPQLDRPTLLCMTVALTLKHTLPDTPGSLSWDVAPEIRPGWWAVGQMPVFLLEDLAQNEHQQRCTEE